MTLELFPCLDADMINPEDALEAALADLVLYRPAASAGLQQQKRQAEGLWAKLPELAGRFEKQQTCIQGNASFFVGMLTEMGLIEKANHAAREYMKKFGLSPPSVDMSIGGLMNQLVREWSEEGALEREQCFGLALAALSELVAVQKGDAGQAATVVIPGAGLSRLCWEVCMLGYHAVGVEAAMTMQLAGQYVINSLLSHGRRATIYPYAAAGAGPCNVVKAADTSRAVHVPDSSAVERFAAVTEKCANHKNLTHPHALLRVTSGDFSAFSQQGSANADAVLTCFYIDASGDVVGTIESVRAALLPGGVWINCGPLEYEGTGGGHALGRMRLCADELLMLIQRFGFELIEARTDEDLVECAYTQDRLSMLQHRFHCLYFVARKAFT